VALLGALNVTTGNVEKIPTGAEFLKLLASLEDSCLSRTDQELPKLGKTT
jgi:hypothetical protein